MSRNEQTDYWTPIRNKGLGATTESSFYGISWNPNEIFHGSKLAINITAIQQLLIMIKSERDVVLTALRKKRERSTINSSNLSPNGEATATSISQKTTQPEKSVVVKGNGSNAPYELQIDFEGITEWLRDNYDGKIPSNEFAQIVNSHFIQAMRFIMVANYFDQLEREAETEDGPFWFEVFIIMAQLFYSLPYVFQTSGELIVGEKSLDDLSTVFYNLLFINLIIHIVLCTLAVTTYLSGLEKTATKKTSVFYTSGKYLLDHLKHADLRPIFYHKNITHSLFIPLAHSFLNRKRYFKKNTSE